MRGFPERTLVTIPVKRVRDVQKVLDHGQRTMLLERIEKAVGKKWKQDDNEPVPREIKQWRKAIRRWEKKCEKARDARWAARTRGADKVREQILFAKTPQAALAAVVKFEKEQRRGK